MPFLLAATVLVFCALYAPQPLLPLFAETYGVSETRAALLITATLLPLSVAPIAYGLWLERLSARRVLAISVVLLGVTQIAFAVADSFTVLVASRVAQGLLIPAAVTALMTFIAGRTPADRLATTMATYIAATVVGGFLGRFLAGLAASYLTWEAAFWVLGLAMVALGPLLLRIQGDQPPNTTRIRWRDCREVLNRGGVQAACIIGFSIFFIFSAVLTYLPFRVGELRPDAGEDTVALLYAGYLMGIVVALGAGRITVWTGSQRRTISLGLLAFLAALVGFLVPEVPVLFAAMILICGGMFLVHGTTPGLINALAPDRRGVINGLYVAAYYAGGTLGAWLPGMLFTQAGWGVMVIAIAAMLIVALMATRHLPEPGPRAEPGEQDQ